MFRLPESVEALRRGAAEFAARELAPGAGRRDLDKEFPAEALRSAAALGYLGLLVPPNFGGQGRGNLAQSAVLEEIACADASVHVTLSVHNSLVCSPIARFGTDDQRSRYLPLLARGERLGAYALTEPGAGSDAASLTTTAVRRGDRYVLNGSKMWITTGDVATLMIVFARTDPAEKRARGISAFLVDVPSKGVTYGRREDKLGIRASSTVQVWFSDVEVPAENRLGEENRGFPIAMDTLNGGRIGIAVQAVGIARAALEGCLLLGREDPAVARRFESSQAVQWRLATMAARIEAARLLTWKAASLRDADEPHIIEASMAKLVSSTTCNDVVRDAMTIAGDAAFAGRCLVERLFRDARITELYEGTTEVQKLVIYRHLVQEEARA